MSTRFTPVQKSNNQDLIFNDLMENDFLQDQLDEISNQMYNTESPKIIEPIAKTLLKSCVIEDAEDKSYNHNSPKKDPLDINFNNTMEFED